VNNLRRLGWGDADLASDGSDRLIDAVIAWGDVDAIVRRVRGHLDAGADQVCIQVHADPSSDPALGAFRKLAAALLETGPLAGPHRSIEPGITPVRRATSVAVNHETRAPMNGSCDTDRAAETTT